MAEKEEGVTEDQQAAPTAPEPKAPGEDLDHWKSMSRRNERDAKLYARERDEANARLAEAEARVAELEAAAAYDAAVREVAEATGYPEKLVRGLKGATADELAASAALLRDGLGAGYSAYPPSRDGGEPKPPTPTRESIEGIRSPEERVMARARNIGLYE